MSAVILLVVVALVSLLVTRVATIALTVTGLPHEAARFQARSALTGVGFTTSETEQVVNHPVRRRIVMALMLVGNVGLVTAMAGLLGGFLGAGGQASAVRIALLVGGLAAVYTLSRSPWVDRHLSRLIRRVLFRHTDLRVRDYASLLHLHGDYAIHELLVEEGDWLAGHSLGELRLKDEGLLVIGVIGPEGRYEGVPSAETRLLPGETAILYGRGEAFTRLAQRGAGRHGDREHEEQVAAQRRIGERERRAAERPEQAGDTQRTDMR